jgi:hypothetical protein
MRKVDVATSAFMPYHRFMSESSEVGRQLGKSVAIGGLGSQHWIAFSTTNRLFGVFGVTTVLILSLFVFSPGTSGVPCPDKSPRPGGTNTLLMSHDPMKAS